jgi:uncharacterized RDD family membrane protein YckC
MAEKPTKVVFRRGVAFLVDSIPGIALYWFMVAAVGDKVGEEPGTNLSLETELVHGDVRAQIGDSVYYLTGDKFALVALVAMTYWIVLFVIVQGVTGATLGKALVGVRTVDAAGRTCGIGRAAIRWLLLIVDAFFYLFPIVGLVTALATDGNRRVGDLAAGTFVVRRSAVGQPVQTKAASVAGPGTQPHWDPARGAHVVWEPRQQIWLEWDPAASRWKPAAD